MGYHLDKDIIDADNKIYCPEKCIFSPPDLNKFVSIEYNNNGGTHSGVTLKSRDSKYYAQINIPPILNGGIAKRKHIGSFDNPKDASDAYMKEKHRIALLLIKAYPDLPYNAKQSLINRYNKSYRKELK